ncbi:Tim44 domain-containing protein [Massilia glaciei]|uniref:Tim44 domain-containing protein n=1 Tax=Massilia glaciei TaxID=1524097 RepID=A0A2U2I4L1_9BURK|nr:Tim44-like domain-containing protein [Massilia glaciei]PWF54744.1 Tim44 domain-containing protein [Massilia glaciei]
MKKTLISLLLALSAVSSTAVSAGSLSGGRSIGLQSAAVAAQVDAAQVDSAAQQEQAPVPAPAQPAPPAKPENAVTGMLGGALLGLGLGAVFAKMGIGPEMASLLATLLMLTLIALAALLVYRMVRRKDTPANAPFAGAGQGKKTPAAAPPIGAKVPPAAAAPWGVPSTFDADGFLRHAKASFIRMQAAWDKADVDDLRKFTTPQVFAELSQQIVQRGAVGEVTEVVAIDAELLGIENMEKNFLASVKFTGMLTSAPGTEAVPFAEVWNMSKPVAGGTGWVLAGIQQLS